MKFRSYRERMTRWVEERPVRLTAVLNFLLVAMLLASVSKQPNPSILLAVALPLFVLMLV